MKKLLSGLRQFQETYIPNHKSLLAELARGQHPRVLFIACSDSRVDPALITQADIGDLFVIRNAGNIVPPYEASNGGEGATIEYAIEALDIKQIIVCGHTHCGAMKGLLQIGELEEKMPLVYDWLRHTAATRKLVQDNYGHLDETDMLGALEAENVLTQIGNLRTYPVIHSRLHRGDLSIHAWLYNIEAGEVLAYDSEDHAFVPPYSRIYPEPGDKVRPSYNIPPLPNPPADISGSRAYDESKYPVWPSPEIPTMTVPPEESYSGAKTAAKAPEKVPTHLPGGSRLSQRQAERIFRGS
ncbi:carbonic anhydrase [Pseudanabaena sp. FACHB-2040]|uniref:carbonic anhydrase n=1 Tax=Pseudanabaena sp. FACHB-2040 TaxID=2692859 RepID=UPI001688442F|nr:carbonic anhydrase [Pseudanabaena sp. FACHB-2040]MBD2260677.1 carbonic anhydrase [Pseudanabaena sp. FACHB-2040]